MFPIVRTAFCLHPEGTPPEMRLAKGNGIPVDWGVTFGEEHLDTDPRRNKELLGSNANFCSQEICVHVYTCTKSICDDIIKG